MSYQEKIADIRQQGGVNFHFPDMKNGGVKPGIWNHICLSYSTAIRHLVYVHNGLTQLNYTHVPLAFEVNDGLPKSFFTPGFRFPGNFWESQYWNETYKSCIKKPNTQIPMCKNKEALRNVGLITLLTSHHNVGFVTDHNMWNRSLSISELVEWTTCKVFEKGNLLPWNRDDWTAIQRDEEGNPIKVYDDVVVDSESFCIKPSHNGKTYTVFPDEIYNFYNGFKLCQQFGGTMAHTRTSEELTTVMGFIKNLRETSSKWKEVLSSGRIWYRYTDEEEEGVWKDPETGFIASFVNCPENPAECFGIIPWKILHDPEGGRAENCACGLKSATLERSAYDITCDTVSSVICEDIAMQMNLRGLCSSSRIGKKYLMAREPAGKRRYFTGYTGWTLIYEDDIWMLKKAKINDTFARFTTSKNYPLGRRDWLITNDVCSGTGEHKVTLMFSACDQNQFTCDDGTCISMTSRCDRMEDCLVCI